MDPIHITDPDQRAAISDWYAARQHSARWAIQELQGVAPDDQRAVIQAHQEPRAQEATDAHTMWHVTHMITRADLVGCWQYYAHEYRRSSPSAITDLDHTPAPSRETSDAYRTAIRAHLQAIETAHAEAEATADL